MPASMKLVLDPRSKAYEGQRIRTLVAPNVPLVAAGVAWNCDQDGVYTTLDDIPPNLPGELQRARLRFSLVVINASGPRYAGAWTPNPLFTRLPSGATATIRMESTSEVLEWVACITAPSYAEAVKLYHETCFPPAEKNVTEEVAQEVNLLPSN